MLLDSNRGGNIVLRVLPPHLTFVVNEGGLILRCHKFRVSEESLFGGNALLTHLRTLARMDVESFEPTRRKIFKT